MIVSHFKIYHTLFELNEIDETFANSFPMFDVRADDDWLW